jgi:hypothetical protein
MGTGMASNNKYANSNHTITNASEDLIESGNANATQDPIEDEYDDYDLGDYGSETDSNLGTSANSKHDVSMVQQSSNTNKQN